MPPLIPMLSALLSGPALAAPLGPIDHALVVGSNRPGPGQQALTYAVEDALRVHDVFTELGALPAGNIVLLEDPSADELRAALDELSEELQAHPGGVLFYYSGHARASALDLGGEAFGLAELDQRLDALPAELRLVVLDACQAGALSQVKGAQPAPAFSVASVEGLHTEGTVVIASSTATELSQESEELQGSYFTHHLVVGLRGAADQDLDGAVTLGEAYRYAYHRTVTSTASTSVGRQHPTLETDLVGRGELVLTRPGGATARLRFGPERSGEVLLVRSDSETVAAEVSKSSGDALTLALAAGAYDVWWSRNGDTVRCTQTLEEGRLQEFAPSGCRTVRPERTAAKGGGLPGSELETFALELGIGGASLQDDAYTDRLSDFGFHRPFLSFSDPVRSTSLVWSPARHVALVGNASTLASETWQRSLFDEEGPTNEQAFEWTGSRWGLQARGQLPSLRGWLVPYLQAGGGLATARTVYIDAENEEPERHWGWHLVAGGGLQLVPSFPRFRHIGGYAQAEVLTAPVIENLLGDVHDSGGLAVTLGLRASL